MIDERELERTKCMGDDGAVLIVVCYQHFAGDALKGAKRRYPGARRWALLDGQAVRLIDSRTFEVAATGELITKHP